MISCDVDKVDIFIKATYTASVTECLPLLHYIVFRDFQQY